MPERHLGTHTVCHKVVVGIMAEMGSVVARGAAQVLHIDVIFILFPVCRNFISLLRRTPLNAIIPFDKNVEFHSGSFCPSAEDAENLGCRASRMGDCDLQLDSHYRSHA
jgi:hypothetical protein